MKVDHTPQGVPSWVELMTTDEQAAVSFYTSLFGWADDPQQIPAESGGGVYHMETLEGDNIAGLGKQNDAEVQQGVPPHWTVYIAVDDADAVTSKVAGAGGQVVLPPMDVMDIGRMAYIADPTGGVVGLWQAKLHRGFGRRGEPGAVNWCELITDDAARASSFLTTVLDVPAEALPSERESTHPYLLIGPENEQAAGVMQKTPEMGQMPNVWGVYFGVADADATVAKARSLGATVLQEPTDIMPGRFAMLQDPQGAVFGIIKSNPMGM